MFHQTDVWLSLCWRCLCVVNVLGSWSPICISCPDVPVSPFPGSEVVPRKANWSALLLPPPSLTRCWLARWIKEAQAFLLPRHWEAAWRSPANHSGGKMLIMQREASEERSELGGQTAAGLLLEFPLLIVSSAFIRENHLHLLTRRRRSSSLSSCCSSFRRRSCL